MRKTKELIAFEMLTNDANEMTDRIGVVFLDSKLLKMADEFKTKPNKANSLGRQKAPLLRRSAFRCR